ncbi:MAG: hypothetical protein J6W12_02695 [Bacteroidales bacterium]|nr:hypothetical protein [Bacteroidales bacterium]
MKKILFAIAFVTMMAFGASAQRMDGFFGNYDNGYDDRGTGNSELILGAPNHNLTENTTGAPLGSGLLVLTALGAGYAVARKRKK